MGSDDVFQVVWEATNELRFVTRTVNSTSHGQIGLHGSVIGVPGVKRILQQKWVDQYGHEDWRDVPEVME